MKKRGGLLLNLMILDDDYYSVDSLKKKLNWRGMGFDDVFCAYSASQARERFLKSSVEVLLTDIEMPKGDGIDFLEWVRRNNYTTECVFLTCYAEFGYCSKALKLQCVDYLLKPAESGAIEAAVLKAVKKIKSKEVEIRDRSCAERWLNTEASRLDHFWQGITSGRIPASLIPQQIQDLYLPSGITEGSLIPVLMDWSGCQLCEEPDGGEREMRSVLGDTFGAGLQAFAYAGKSAGFAILSARCERVEVVEVMNSCEQLLASCGSRYGGTFRIFVGKPCAIEALGPSCASLADSAKRDVTQRSFIRDEGLIHEANPKKPFPKDLLRDELLQMKLDEAQSVCSSHIKGMAGSKRLDRGELKAFLRDFQTAVQSAAEMVGIAKSSEFQEALSGEDNATDSAFLLEEHVKKCVAAYGESVKKLASDDALISRIKQYVSERLPEDISRDEVAKSVFISPCYLSHMFRSKTGLSLTEYIAGERVKKAKALLLQNRLSVRDVAIESGFGNIAYFSKQFKRATGVTPREFKLKGQK
jgi:two-component system response regulator YesN